MVIDEFFTTVLPRFKDTNAGTVVHVGTGERSTLSSSNTDDYIPEKIRRIFAGADNEKWFTVYYLGDKTQIARGMFHFEGRDHSYEEIVIADASDILRSVFIVYNGQTVRYEVAPKWRKAYTKGKPFKMKFNGDIIP